MKNLIKQLENYTKDDERTKGQTETNSVNIMKMVQSSIQLDLILTNPILKDDIQSLLIFLITSNIHQNHNNTFLNETDNVKLYKIWLAITNGHKKIKYNNELININKNILWSYEPNPNLINQLTNKKLNCQNITQKKIYLKKILDEIDDMDMSEFLDYVDLYYDACIEKDNNVLNGLSNKIISSSY